MAKKLMCALQEYATLRSVTWLHGEKLMLAFHDYATPSNATCLHGEKVDVSIAGVCYNQ